jgi:hypothetical protein
VHKPTPEMGLQVMCSSWEHWVPDPPGVHKRAQYLSPDWSCKTHCGLATVKGQTSVGQPPDGKHLGAQKAPGTPETVTFTSPGWQEGVLYGSSYSQVAWGLRREAPLNCGWKSSFKAGDATATPARRAKMAALFMFVRKGLLVKMDSI